MRPVGIIANPASGKDIRRLVAYGSVFGNMEKINIIKRLLIGLDSVGEDMSKPYVRKAVRWLKANQNLDGGWGEGCESYDDPNLKCCGASTPSQTAWALLALIAAGEIAGKEVSKGIEYLLETQRSDGTWEEKSFTGTGFPKYFYLRYHNYRNCFPLMALGRFLSRSVEEMKR